MTSSTMKERLADPEYLGLHLLAVGIVGRLKGHTWYDARFHWAYHAATRFLADARPDRLEDFVAAFAPLRTPKDFTVQRVSDLFPAHDFQCIKDVAATLPDARLERHEAGRFGRNIVQDDPYFTALQRQVTPLVSDLAGMELVPIYNFLSLYGTSGNCDPHLDNPEAMFTLDICLSQNCEWPIYHSNVVDWPTADQLKTWSGDVIVNDPTLSFSSSTLSPNEAILFSGSGQWHYRNRIPQNGYCNLLFFHYCPKGCENLVDPMHWPDHFAIPELCVLLDVISEAWPLKNNDGI